VCSFVRWFVIQRKPACMRHILFALILVTDSLRATQDGSPFSLLQNLFWQEEWALRYEWGHSLHTCKTDCTMIALWCCAVSATMSAAVWLVGLTCCSVISLVLVVLSVMYSFFIGVFQAWGSGGPVDRSCIALCILQIFLVIHWALVVLFIKLDWIDKMIVLFCPDFIGAMESIWQKKKSQISGPSRELYESNFFYQLCEDAFHDADAGETGNLNVSEFRIAVCNMLRDPEWGRNDLWLSILFSAHARTQIDKHDCLKIMMYICAMELVASEDAGVPHISHDFHIMQLRSDAGYAEAEAAYVKLAEKWNPHHRYSVSEEQAKRDHEHVGSAGKRVLEHLSRQA